jgi:Ino eighty subunit 1
LSGSKLVTRPAKDRKIIAIKLQDGQPLTRVDLQYDLLHHIFANDKAVFTDINTSIDGKPPRSKVTFRDLYLNTLLRSPKCSRGPREKALENPEFGTEFAKIALLTNAGRINTTMACDFNFDMCCLSWL